MTPSAVVDIADLQDQCQRSIERSRHRRLAAEEWRRGRFRRRGGHASVAATGLLVAVSGAGVASAHSGGAGGSADQGAANAYLLSQGRHSSGDEVAALQRTLEDIPVDGRFGETTKAKVRRFQRKEGLQVDGIVGPRTRASLGMSEPVVQQPAAPPQAHRQAPQSRQAAPAPRREVPAPQAQPEPHKQAPQPEPAPDPSAGVQKAPSGSSSRSSSTAGGGGGNVPGALSGIAQCESGGNPGAIGGGGSYRGKYQFTRETWRGLGGSGDPAKAPESEQDQRAAQLYSRSGASSWPTCGR